MYKHRRLRPSLYANYSQRTKSVFRVSKAAITITVVLEAPNNPPNVPHRGCWGNIRRPCVKLPVGALVFTSHLVSTLI